MYRFLNNEKVTEAEIIKKSAQSCSNHAVGQRVVAMIDTSVIRLSNKLNRLKDLEGLYSTGRYESQERYGFHISPSLVFKEETMEPIGIAHTKIIERQGRTRREKGVHRARYYEDIERKESYKWIESCLESQKVLKQAQHLTCIVDREADIIELLDRIPDKRTTLLVRSNFKRRIILEDGSKMNLEDFLSTCEVKDEYKLNVGSKKRRKREAILELKFEEVKLAWPKGKQTLFRKNPEGVKVTIIEVKEKMNQGYKDEVELSWRLICSDKIQTTEQALQQVELYRNRWKIEEFFKLLKTDGFDIEGTELTKGKTIRKLTLLIMEASIKILKLKAARSGESQEKINSVFDEDEIECIKLLNKKYEGKTEKKKNPFEEESLSYASWVIARIGGWKEYYDKNRPPGSKTFIWGLEKFDAIVLGYKINKKDVS